MALSAAQALNYPAPTTANGSQASVNTAYNQAANVMAQQDAAQQPIIDKYKQIASQPMPQSPEPQKATPAPDYQKFQQDSQQWVVAFSALSSLVGARGRGRGTAALKAFAGGVQGLHDGNKEAYEAASKKWKSDTDAMMKENEEQRKKYEDILKNRELSESEAVTEMKLVAAQYENPTMLAVENLHQAGAVHDSIVKAQASATAAMQKLEQHEKMKEEHDAKLLEKYKNDPSIENDAEAFHNGRPIGTLVKGMGAEAAAQAEAIKQAAYAKYGSFDEAAAQQDYVTAQTALRSYGSGKNGDIVRSFNVAYNHADTVGKLAEALGNGDVPRANALKQQFEQEFGYAAPTNFDAARTILSDEINKAAVGTSGALADRLALASNTVRSASPEQINGALGTYKSLIVGQMAGQKQEYEQATKRKDFERLLSPKVAADLKKYEAEQAPASQGGKTKTIGGVTYTQDANGDWHHD